MAQEKGKQRGAETIDANLRRVYQDVLNEEVPDRFRALLDELKEQDASKSGRNGDSSQ